MRVIVATDLSFGAGAAVHWVDANLSDADVSVVHCRREQPRGGDEASTRASRNGTLREKADAWLLEHAPTLYHRGGVVELVHSDDLDTLHKLTRLRSAELLVVGQQGEETGSPRRLGRTADHLVRHANVAVLVVPALPHRPPSRLLVALDGGELEPSVLSWARRLSQRFEAHVVGLHVVPASVPSHVLASADDALPSDRDEDASGPTRDTWLRELLGAGVPADRAASEVAFGDAGSELLVAAERHEAGLILLGGGRKGRVRRAVLGSVVRDVLHHATCPVLVVSGPEDEIE